MSGRPTLRVSTINSMPSARKKRCWFAGSSSTEESELNKFSMSSASSRSAGSRRLYWATAVSNASTPSFSPRYALFDSFC